VSGADLDTDSERRPLVTVTVDAGSTADFAAPFRRELLAHCYRMLGSVHDAEDAVQETMLRAWQGFEGFEGRSSLRVWLYRIATNVCLRALERRARLPLPSGLGAPAEDADGPVLGASGGARWLEPIPDALLAACGDESGGSGPGGVDPANATVVRSSVRLAFVSALQHLPARGRAALILREVYAFSAQETAEILESSVASVNRALQRARAQIAAVAPTEEQVHEPTDPERRRQLDRYLHAFEHCDIEGLARILHEDVVLEMPPIPTWFRGRAAVGRFLGRRVAEEGGRLRMVPIAANGQPGYASYLRGEDGTWSAHAIHVLDPASDGLARISVFLQPELFGIFGLAMSSSDGADLHS
jgi:RNA polymerase sigma-70 factor (ECF subfamily)